ncbi:MAG: hypothetical protein EOP83_19970 [Verrucomicrobiaceae bacterium]|nr:MAG: hypothetical protein EOP83_19970 [Verrucomicrobiaceae bacterium]
MAEFIYYYTITDREQAGWHSVLIPDVKIQQLDMNEVAEWLLDSLRKGKYSACGQIEGMYFQFSDSDLALEFKLRWL